MYRLSTLTLLIMLSLLQAYGKTQKINGTKIHPENNAIGLITNSVTGEGIAGVPVTDGYTFTLTDANGVYQMVADDSCRLIYYTTPAGYEISIDSRSGIPDFYTAATPAANGAVNRYDFTLTPLAEPEDSVTLIMIGDPQCRTDAEIMRLRNETLPDIRHTLARKGYPNVYAFTLGDLTFDNVVMWPRIKTSLVSQTLDDGRLMPVFNCVGNHDHDAAKDSDYDALHNYVATFGPTDYSLDRANLHIVVMDDIICTHKKKPTSWSYRAGFTPRQIEWLRADLANVTDKHEKEVILCLHIPFRGNTDGMQQEVLQMLSEFKDAHIMIGHTHYPQNFIHHDITSRSGLPIYEHIHGAACGAWWSCNSNTDGAPNGYSIYEFSPAGLHNWTSKATGMDIDTQMRVWDGSQVYGDTYPLTWHSGGTAGTANIEVKGIAALDSCFVVELWNDDGPAKKHDTTGGNGNWQVELVTAGGDVLPMTRIDTPIVNIPATAYYFNEMNRNSRLWTHPSRHIWYVKAPSGGTAADESGWTVRATQTIPYSGVRNVYECRSLSTDYSIF